MTSGPFPQNQNISHRSYIIVHIRTFIINRFYNDVWINIRCRDINITFWFNILFAGALVESHFVVIVLVICF